VKNRIIAFAVSFMATIAFSIESLFAGEATDNSLTAFPWWKHCKNPLPDNIYYTDWHNISLVMWLAIALMAIAFVAYTANHLAKRKRPLTDTRVNLFLLFLIIILTIFLGYNGFADKSQDPVTFFFNALKPSEGENILTILWSGFYAPLVRMFSANENIIYIPARIFGIINIVLVYQLSELIFNRSRQSLLAALVFAMSLANLKFFSTDVPTQQTCTLVLLVATSISGKAYAHKTIFSIFSIVFTSFAVMLLPALAIPVAIFTGLFIFSTTAKTDQSRAILTVFVTISMGLYFFFRIYPVYKVPFVLHLIPDVTNLSILFVAVTISGLYFARKSKQYSSFILAASAIAMLFIVPILPQNLIANSAWLIIPLTLLSPIAGHGIYNIAAWTGQKQFFVIVIIIVLLILPTYLQLKKIEPSPEVKRYRFMKITIETIKQEKSVIYKSEKRHPLYAPFPEFLAKHGESPCIRPRQAIASDPKSHGTRWIYFGPECIFEKPQSPPKPDSCQFYKSIYTLGDCISTTIPLHDNDGNIVAEEKHEFCKVTGRK